MQKKGFSLIELLIVLAILALLVSLLFPAIQSTRESSRRMQCAGNLRQLCLAMLNFESAQSKFPPGYLSDGRMESVYQDPDTWDTGPGWGWGTYILPYLEGGPLQRELNLKLPIWAEPNRRHIDQHFSVFLCPSSEMTDSFLALDKQGNVLTRGGRSISLGRSHFVANHGQESCWGECGANLRGIVFSNIYSGTTREVLINGDVSRVADGPFYRNSRTRTKHVKDGMSKTIFLGEHGSALSDKTWVGVVPGAFTHPRIPSRENSPDAAATLVLAHAGPSGGELDITGFPIIHPMNYPTNHVGQMFSEHPSGGNVALGDGSVRFVSEDVNLFVWAEFSSMAEGETTGEL